MLKDKNIVVAVTGSIAVYKTCELIRLYTKAGANVKVVMSKAAQKFITALTYEALTRQKVLTDENESWSCELNHIDFAKWAELIVIAPATANTINKLSKGIADNLLTQVMLASRAKKLIAPSANTNMMLDPNTVVSLEILKGNEYTVIGSQTKELACGDTGTGAMAEVERIYEESIKALHIDDFYKDRKVIVTSGGSKEKIDDVRFISNFSSGKMGASLARWLYYKGAEVFYLSFGLHDVPQGVSTVEVESSKQMQESLVKTLKDLKNSVEKEQLKEPFLFMVAAVSDYLPKVAQKGKLKKNSLGKQWNLELVQNSDILASLDKKRIKTIGFKAELDKTKAKENALKMLKEKKLDGVCLNVLNSSSDFGGEENAITLFTKDKEIDFAKMDKLALSKEILEGVKQL